MTDPRPLPNQFLRSLHGLVKRNDGGFKSLKQRKFLLNRLAEFAVCPPATDLEARVRWYTIVDIKGVFWGFKAHGRNELPHLERKRFGACPEHVTAPAVEVQVGPVLSDEIRTELAELLKWGPSEFVFTAPSVEAIAALTELAQLNADALAISRSRKTDTAWGADDLNHITQVQIAAKGLLCEVGDNAGTSPVAMSAADAEYVSQLLTEGHIRNACRFKITSTGFEGIRAACIVNRAKMPEATAALADRMVALMNAATEQLGRPVSFAEYTEALAA